ncbi:hypothetical protein IWQ61_002289 [Dispira simplex]|nr:hypothetical protein IWQ61_002289 [Dispira simplex]
MRFSKPGFARPKIKIGKIGGPSRTNQDPVESGKTNAVGDTQTKEYAHKDAADDIAKVYDEFVASFEVDQEQTQTFVPEGNVGVKYQQICSQGPTSEHTQKPLNLSPSALEKSSPVENDDERPPPSIPGRVGRKKRNLDTFLEELKRGQETRTHRSTSGIGSGSTTSHELGSGSRLSTEELATTTNLFIRNLCPQVNEETLCKLFAEYGPIGSVKIMWPRTPEEYDRNRNSGFVSYMTRSDAEEALQHLNGHMLMGYSIQLGWGKMVPLPLEPIYVLEKHNDTPPSGLPFNAQIPKVPTEDNPRCLAEVHVVIPTDQRMRRIIHRTVERVLVYGPAFEALLMDHEWQNPDFQFLFTNESSLHIYYRWKLFSLLQGDRHSVWRTEPFQMFINGPLWVPPEIPFDESLSLSSDSELEAKELEERDKAPKGVLSRHAKQRLRYLLLRLDPSRGSILHAMIFTMEHAGAAEQVSTLLMGFEHYAGVTRRSD